MDDVATPTLAEDLQIEVWRMKQFAQMKFSADDIMRLKRSDVDTHMAQDLIDAGCPPELAIEILL